MNTNDEVLMQNARFYEAFEQKDLNVIDQVWSHADYVKCVHPGWTVLVGWNDVRQSWTTIFANATNMKFSLRNVRADVFGTIATIVLEEEVTYASGAMRQTHSVMATNIFQHDGTTWRMIHHHGSHILGIDQSTPGSEKEDQDRFRYN